MLEQNYTDPRRAYWSGVGGALDDPAIRQQRGTVRKQRLLPRLRARLRRLIRG
jgi:hypothetical protein